jgi:AraC-like DNA-binding protein
MTMPLEPSTLSSRRRREGFANQRLVVLPEMIVRSALELPLLSGLIPVAAGFFPAAERHLVERKRPLADAIVILCVSGQGWVQLGDGRRHSVPADTLVFVPPDEPHAYGADEVDPWSIFWAHLRGNNVADFARLFGMTNTAPTVVLTKGAAARVEFSEIYERLEEDYTMANLLSAAARMRLVFAELHRWTTREVSQRTTDPTQNTIAWMRQHMQERADLPRLARLAGLSVPHYSAVFRHKTGYPPVDYFLRMKVQHACWLLDTTSMRIEEIARALGYGDAFYFSRLFRKIMTQSPRAYRLAAKG